MLPKKSLWEEPLTGVLFGYAFICGRSDEGVFRADHAETARVFLLYFFRDRFFRLARRKLAIRRQYEVEDQIHVRFAFRHSEVVYRKVRVHLFRRGERKRVQLVHERIVHHERVEVDRYDTAEFFVHIPFQFIHFLVRDIDVRIRRHFRVEGNDLPTGSVIVHHNVVDTHHVRVFRFIVRERVNTLDELGGGGRTEQQIDGFLRRFHAREQYERRNEYPREPVYRKIEISRDQRGDKYERGRRAIAQTVCRRGFERGGVDELADLTVKEEQPDLDEDRRAEQDQGRRADRRQYGFDDLIDRRFQKFESNDDDDHIDDKAGHVFEPTVTLRVFLIDGLAREPYTDERDDGRACVGDIVERVGDDRHRRRQNTERKFACEQKYIQKYARKPRERGVSAANGGGVGIGVFADEKSYQKFRHKPSCPLKKYTVSLYAENVRLSIKNAKTREKSLTSYVKLW